MESKEKTTLNIDELQELLRLSFNKGLSVGKKMKPLNEIPMGSFIKSPVVIFNDFFKETILNLKNEK